jgi:putative Holliday junction resolvase
MNILALDVGEARIGVAKAEMGSSLAFGRGVIAREGLEADLEAIEKAARAENASLMVVGLPRRTDGADSGQTARVRAFAKALEKRGLAVTFEDERFTTRVAAQWLASSGLPQHKRQEKGRLDEAAAVLILESYLAKASHSRGE